jgi:hypothetical protein
MLCRITTSGNMDWDEPRVSRDQWARGPDNAVRFGGAPACTEGSLVGSAAGYRTGSPTPSCSRSRSGEYGIGSQSGSSPR